MYKRLPRTELMIHVMRNCGCKCLYTPNALRCGAARYLMLLRGDLCTILLCIAALQCISVSGMVM